MTIGLQLIIILNQAQHEKIKRKALLAPENPAGVGAPRAAMLPEDTSMRSFRTGAAMSGSGTGVDVGAVVGNMEANGVSHIAGLPRLCPLTS